MKKFLAFILFGILETLPVVSKGQECPQFPADCPTDMSATQDSMNCIQALIVPEEIVMQNQLRAIISGRMQKIADEKHWRVYEYSEFADDLSGPGVDPNTGRAMPLSYPLRRPHEFDMSFIFIINEDSLSAWQYWYNHDLQNRGQQVIDQFKEQAGDQSFQDQLKSYMDSANYYTNLKASYMNDHSAEYQQALLSNNQAAIKKIEAGSKQWDKQSDYWMNKASKRQKQQLAPSTQSTNGLQKYSHEKMISFRNASMLRIKFLFNNPVLQIADESGIVQISRRLNLSNTTKSIMYRNNRPDEKAIHDLNQFTRTIDLGLLLYGQWISQNDQVFHATFSRNPKDMDHITQKRIRSDKVRTIAVVIEGSAAEIPVFANMLDHQELNRLIIP